MPRRGGRRRARARARPRHRAKKRTRIGHHGVGHRHRHIGHHQHGIGLGRRRFGFGYGARNRRRRTGGGRRRGRVRAAGGKPPQIQACLCVLGTIAFIPGAVMTGVGYSDVYRDLQIVGPVVLSLSLLLIATGIIMCCCFRKNAAETPDEETADAEPDGDSPVVVIDGVSMVMIDGVVVEIPPEGMGQNVEPDPYELDGTIMDMERTYPAASDGYPVSGEGYPVSGDGYPASGEGYPASGEGYLHPEPPDLSAPPPSYEMATTGAYETV